MKKARPQIYIFQRLDGGLVRYELYLIVGEVGFLSVGTYDHLEDVEVAAREVAAGIDAGKKRRCAVGRRSGNLEIV